MRFLQLVLACAICSFALPALVSAQQTELPIYRFAGTPNDGEFPTGGLVADPSGDLYGTTSGGGPPQCRLQRGCGTIFQMVPPVALGQSWTEHVLYEFSTANFAAQPASGLVRDAAGNLYGTSPYGEGAVYELSPPVPPATTWSFNVLYAFTGQSDGYLPYAGLILDSKGNLYGTTAGGGNAASCPQYAGCGTVFEINPPSAPGGAWTETVFYAFDRSLGDGYYPVSGLVFDPAGNLYGTTEYGDPSEGTIFRLKPPTQGSGPWTETVVYQFANGDDSNPLAGLVRDQHGNFYGTANRGGANSYGTVFELSPKPGDHWSKQTLYSFTNGTDGQYPSAPVTLVQGGMYGTTSRGGSAGGGSVFKLVQNADGTWMETTLHEFTGHSDGLSSQAGVIFGKGRLLYGTTEYGGSVTHNFGTAFEVKP